MKLVGNFLLLTGWILVLCAILLFPAALQRNIFTLAGIAVEALGLALLFRAHQQYRGEDQ